MIKRAYKYRIYPTTNQKEFFSKTFGCARFFYNKSLEDIRNQYKITGKIKNITPASYKKDYPFLKEVDAFALCNAQLNRNKAIKKSLAETRCFPRFKSKKHEQKYTTNNSNELIRFSDDGKYLLSVPKCGKIRIKKHRDFNGSIKSLTITKTCDDRYFVSILVETEAILLEETRNVVGLDLGIKKMIVDSNGLKYTNHKYFTKSEKKLNREQRKLAKMKKNSKNRDKQRKIVARINAKISNQRKDYLHKITKRIIDENQVICIESLLVKDMEHNNKLAKNISDVSWSRLVTMLIYKADWYGRKLIKVPDNYPSSQLCHVCGYKNSITRDLAIRKWTCPKCGSIHDRDINAAKNILSKGIETLTKDGTHPDSLFMLGS